MTELKPAYLIWGDDEVRIDAWRTRVRARAESEGPATTLEVLRDERLSVAAAAEAIGALTLSVGRRYLMLDGIERCNERELGAVEEALARIPVETVVILIAHGKQPARLVKAVEAAGGEVHACAAPRPGAYPAWLTERARELGLDLSREAVDALLDRIGNNQQRLLRELEKLSTFAGQDRRIDSDAIEALTMPAVEARTYELADALIEGDRARALRIAEDLRARGEDMMHILFALLRQLRNCHRAWAMLAAGRSTKQVQSALRVPPFVARRLVAQAGRTDGERLEGALDLLADLDYAIRGAGRLDPESSLTLTLAAASGQRPVTA